MISMIFKTDRQKWKSKGIIQMEFIEIIEFVEVIETRFYDSIISMFSMIFKTDRHKWNP